MRREQLGKLLSEIERTFPDYHDFYNRNLHDVYVEGRMSRPAEVNIWYSTYFTSPQFPVSSEDMHDLRSKFDNTDLSSSDEFDCLNYILKLLLMKQMNTPRSSIHGRLNILSIGVDCLPRNLATKFGFKPPRLLGEKSTPFDLAIHPLPSVSEAISSSFRNYLDSDKIYLDEGAGFIIHNTQYIQWNHERGQEWVENDFSKFKNRYAARIENFYHALNDGKKTLLVLRADTYVSTAELSRFRAAISDLAGSVSNELAVVVVMTSGHDGDASFDEGTVGDRGTRFFVLDLPTPGGADGGYEWWMPGSYTRPEGLAFELAIAQKMSDVIDVMLPDTAPNFVSPSDVASIQGG